MAGTLIFTEADFEMCG